MTSPAVALRRLPLTAQVALVMASVAMVASTMMWTLVPMAVRVALAQQPGAVAEVVLRPLGLVTAGVIACTLLAAVGAAAWLKGSLSATVGEMQRATRRIADGAFEHRIASARRDELGRLAEDIDGMAGRLDRLERSRQEFLAAVTHELRTPLTVARGHAFTLLRGEQDEQRRERLQLIDDEIGRVASIVDDLLLAATLRARPLRLTPSDVELVDVAERAVERFHYGAAARGLVLECVDRTRGARVVADELRLDQLLANLLSNAIRHADPGSAVTVGLDEVAAGVRVSVSNVGPPIPDELAERLFEPFVQGEGIRGSAGLGLSIARELAHAHGSPLSLERRRGRTRFTFELERPRSLGRRAPVPRLVPSEVLT